MELLGDNRILHAGHGTRYPVPVLLGEHQEAVERCADFLNVLVGVACLAGGFHGLDLVFFFRIADVDVKYSQCL